MQNTKKKAFGSSSNTIQNQIYIRGTAWETWKKKLWENSFQIQNLNRTRKSVHETPSNCKFDSKLKKKCQATRSRWKVWANKWPKNKVKATSPGKGEKWINSILWATKNQGHLVLDIWHIDEHETNPLDMDENVDIRSKT